MENCKKKVKLDYLVINETKADERFPWQQFVIDNFGIKSWKDRDRHDVGLVAFARKGGFLSENNIPGAK